MPSNSQTSVNRQVLVKILLDTFKSAGISGKLAFKGGTCAYLFYDLPRMSLDLDFDLLSPFGKHEPDMLRAVFSRHAAIRESRDKQFTAFFLLDYEKGAPNIKVEINKRIWRSNVYKTVWFLGVNMKIADEQTVATNKIIALSDRISPVSRDLFDAYYFLKLGFKLNEKLIHERTGKSMSEYLTYLGTFVDRTYTARNILQGLGEVLEEKQKQWVKGALIHEFKDEITKLLGTP
jgi:predicted nucleotidyltransferase component of viral defense system